jgi:hypothetical protein
MLVRMGAEIVFPPAFHVPSNGSVLIITRTTSAPKKRLLGDSDHHSPLQTKIQINTVFGFCV